jgi:hypothetical protein
MALLSPEGRIILQSIISSAPFEGPDRQIYNKPGFLFGDAAPDPERKLQADDEQWIFTIGEDKFYIPSNKCHYPLTYFTCVTSERKMPWHLNPGRESVILGRFTSHGASRAGPPTYVAGLHPGWISKDMPAGEISHTAITFVNYFVTTGGNYPASDFRAPG